MNLEESASITPIAALRQSGMYIKKVIPDFTMDYDIDPVRQGIAESWPNKMDDSCARAEWDWAPSYDLDTMTEDMIKVLSKRLLNK